MRADLVRGAAALALLAGSLSFAGGSSASPARLATLNGRIVFSEASPPCPSGHCRFHISLLHADGSGRKMLTTSKFPEGEPKWSPDGRLILFESSNRRGCCALDVMRANGSRERQLLKLGVGTQSGDPPATWSANGRFALYVKAFTRRQALMAVRTQGRPRVHRLFVLPGKLAKGVLWEGQAESPNGRWIALGKQSFGRSGSVDEIWLAHPNGKNLHRLVRLPDADFGALSWSPNSKRLAYYAYFAQDAYLAQTDCTSGVPETDQFRAVFVIDIGGGTPKAMWNPQCSDSPAPTDFLPDGVQSISWAPDGGHIVYATTDIAPSGPYTPANEARFGLLLHVVDTAAGTIAGIPKTTPNSIHCHGGQGSADVPCGMFDPDWTKSG